MWSALRVLAQSSTAWLALSEAGRQQTKAIFGERTQPESSAQGTGRRTLMEHAALPPWADAQHQEDWADDQDMRAAQMEGVGPQQQQDLDTVIATDQGGRVRGDVGTSDDYFGVHHLQQRNKPGERWYEIWDAKNPSKPTMVSKIDEIMVVFRVFLGKQYWVYPDKRGGVVVRPLLSTDDEWTIDQFDVKMECAGQLYELESPHRIADLDNKTISVSKNMKRNEETELCLNDQAVLVSKYHNSLSYEQTFRIMDPTLTSELWAQPLDRLFDLVVNDKTGDLVMFQEQKPDGTVIWSLWQWRHGTFQEIGSSNVPANCYSLFAILIRDSDDHIQVICQKSEGTWIYDWPDTRDSHYEFKGDGRFFGKWSTIGLLHKTRVAVLTDQDEKEVRLRSIPAWLGQD